MSSTSFERPGDAPLIVRGPAWCLSCDGPLDDRTLGLRCPHCRALLDHVRYEDLLRGADRQWLERIRRGLLTVHSSLAVATFAVGVLFAAWLVLVLIGAPVIGVFVLFGGAAAVLAGCWAVGARGMIRLAAPEPDINRPDREENLRTLGLLRGMTLTIPASAAAAFTMYILHDGYNVAAALTLPVDALAVLAMTLFMLYYGRWLLHLINRCAASKRRDVIPLRRVLALYRWAPAVGVTLFAVGWGGWVIVYLLTFASPITPLGPPFLTLWVLILWLICLVPSRRAREIIDAEIAAGDSAGS